jgi:pimeloyl-ACP methyl ester carboxylesterase
MLESNNPDLVAGGDVFVGEVRSKDGTVIAFERSGEGPPVILVVGAFNDRVAGAPLAAALQERFTVFNYDRRGRGDSGDTPPYAVEREVEDLEALIEEAGGSASVFGYSSGAVLALRAAARGLAITRLALYDPPVSADGGAGRLREDLAARVAGLVEEGRRGDAVELFQTEAVNLPAEVVAQIRRAPFWPALEAMAHTLVYESEILGNGSLPTELAASVEAPTLIIVGGESHPYLREKAPVLADVMPVARARVLEDQGHDLVPQVLAPVLEEFLADRYDGPDRAGR